MTPSRVGMSAWMVRCATIFAVGNPMFAIADPGKTTWTAYLYQGPGYRYAVADEVPQASSIDVEECANGWCRVKSDDRIGYMRAEVVTRGSLDRPGDEIFAQPAAAVNNATPPGPCFKANQTGGNGGNAMTVFCRK